MAKTHKGNKSHERLGRWRFPDRLSIDIHAQTTYTINVNYSRAYRSSRKELRKCLSKQAGADDMSTTLIVMILGGLLAADLFIASRWKRYRIRQTGTMVMAKVTGGRSWQDTLARADYSLQKTMLPLVNGRWRYEIIAEWTDPNTGKIYVFTSDIKNGLSPYQ